MTNTNILLDKYRKARSLASDKALAESLGITRQSVHQWRQGDAWPTDDHVIAMSRAVHENEGHWLPLIAAERTKSPEARKVWLRLVQAAAAIALTALAYHHNVGELPQYAVIFAYNPGTLSIMFNLALGMVVAWLLSIDARSTQHAVQLDV